ncbi:hypothetical protein BDV98DRAFT_567555 [Pterulicium gracile]|uniref:Uncharacterized protein n=1 Tax=Pterulicium gracile TaxID=1884261 RepID=A0A5C3QID3_9AGAR|nr:hypothetical protein BDV98DRAFT_567555 [Pterula gracilis]
MRGTLPPEGLLACICHCHCYCLQATQGGLGRLRLCRYDVCRWAAPEREQRAYALARKSERIASSVHPLDILILSESCSRHPRSSSSSDVNARHMGSLRARMNRPFREW